MTIPHRDNAPSLVVQGLSSTPTIKPVQRLVLIGGGHAHAQVLRALNQKSRPKRLHVTLIDVQKSAAYSGMVPGCITKAYTPEQTLLDLEPLTDWAGIEFVNDKVIDLDCDNKCIYLRHSNEPVPFDVCSIDIGSASRGVHETPGAKEFTIPTRPISELVQRIEDAEQTMKPGEPQHVAVIGGGAAGVELSMSILGRWKPLLGDNLKLTLLNSGSELLPSESHACRRALREYIDDLGICVRHGCSVAEIQKDVIQLTSGEQIPYSQCVWATGAGPHALASKLQNRGLAVTERGWIRVNRNLQSISHPYIFAAGDCSSMEGLPTGPPPKAGVYAVRAGPVLIENLTGYLAGTKLVDYTPQDDFLKLLVCGDRTAMGFRFGIPIQGKWVFQVKDAIDLQFMSLFRRENLPVLRDGEPYDTSQYDAAQLTEKRKPLPPLEAAELIQRTDDNVDYEMAWNVLRDMTADVTYKEKVLSHMHVYHDAMAIVA